MTTTPDTRDHGLLGQLRITRRALVLAWTFASYGLFETACRTVLGPDLERVLTIIRHGCLSLLEPMGVVMHVYGTAPKGALLVSNHCSYIDIVVIGSNTGTTYLAKSEVADWPIIGQTSTAVGTVYVDRTSAESRRASRIRVRERIAQGVNITVFPEGTTTAGPSTLDFRPGTFATAVDAGVPVVPVAIAYHDPRDAWIGDDGFLEHFTKQFRRPRVDVSVSFGPPIASDDVEELRLAAQTWVRQELARLHGIIGTPYDLIAPEDRIDTPTAPPTQPTTASLEHQPA
ncbi:MAG: lysophospholipid acyltransferase family protein [Myxococcota bacterium]